MVGFKTGLRHREQVALRCREGAWRKAWRSQWRARIAASHGSHQSEGPGARTEPEGHYCRRESLGVASVRAIAAELNARGILTPGGGLWHATSVARLLERLETVWR